MVRKIANFDTGIVIAVGGTVASLIGSLGFFQTANQTMLTANLIAISIGLIRRVVSRSK